ncbi:hypothetical protein JCM13991_04700 [Thermodesulfovibrio hydrogeniphilus]
MKKLLTRLLKRPNWYNLRTLQPISRVFGFDRGTPIDRIYIDDFLMKNSKYIKGTVCEIAEDTYSRKFGSNVKRFEILHYTNDNKKATIIGDLTNLVSLPQNTIDCFILTQTLNFIYDFRLAIKGVHYMLKNEGVVLATVVGISQISRYDMDRWGDYWRFTDLSIKKAFEEVFGKGNVEVETYGNVLAATAFLQGISAEELTEDELFYKDKDYQVTITIKAIKK